MKKSLFAAFLLLCIVFSLSACGGAPQPASSSAPSPTAEPAPAPPAPSASSVLPGSGLQPASAETAAPETPAVDMAAFEAALALKGQDISALYDAIGEPSGSSYAPSCVGPGEDGELYYAGFTVATYREGDKEIVWDVNVNAG